MTGSPTPTRLTELPRAAAAGGNPPGAPPGLPPDGPPFHSALESERARTASAEGHHDNSTATATGAPPREHTDSDAGKRSELAATHLAVSQSTSPPTTTAPGMTTAPAMTTSPPAPSPSTSATPGATGPATEAILEEPAHTATSSPQDPAEAALPARTPDAAETPDPANAPGDTEVRSSQDESSDSTATTQRAPAADSVISADGSAPAGSHELRTPSTASAAPTGTQPTAAGASTPNPSPSPLTPTSAQAPPGASGGAAGTGPSPAAHGPGSGSSDAIARPAASGLQSALAASQQNRGAGSTGDGPAHGAHHDGAHATPTDAAVSSSDSGTVHDTLSVHDTLWVPDPALQNPTETGAPGTSGAPTGPSGAAYLSAADPALASDLGSLADLGALDLGGGLAQAVETLNATIELAARQGISQARIALHPAELGAIRIHLSQTAAGLLARVTADTPAAAQALATGHAELQRQLGQLGLASVRLHIAHGGLAAQGEGGTGTESREAARHSAAHGGELGLPRSLSGARRVGATDAAGSVAGDVGTEATTTPTHSGRALDVLV